MLNGSEVNLTVLGGKNRSKMAAFLVFIIVMARVVIV